MTPTDVTVVTTPVPDSDVPTLVTWTRTTATGPVTVGFLPSKDPAVRRQQEADLIAHLDARTNVKTVAI